jgi:uncharacterized protein YdeI (YjbR/CyaY-like superfamily)
VADPVIAFESPAAWEDWLAREHGSQKGVWIKIAKKATNIPTVTHLEALDVALCCGWIDGQRKPFDEQWFLQRFTPRRPRSSWSKVNRDNVARLLAAGRMQPAGLAEVERAKADGRWEAAYDPASAATVPPELQQALDANPAAAAFFATLNSRNRFAILYRVQEAKRPETRAGRIEKFVAMLAAGDTLYP